MCNFESEISYRLRVMSGYSVTKAEASTMLSM